jgi:hypothetical protein
VVEMITAVMVMIPGMEALLLHGLQEVVVVIIMAVMVNKVVDTVGRRVHQVELLRGNDTTSHRRPRQAVQVMGMGDTQVGATVTPLVDIPLSRIWGLPQGLVEVRADLVHHLGWAPCSRTMVPMDLGTLPHLPHLEMLLLLHPRAINRRLHLLGIRLRGLPVDWVLGKHLLITDSFSKTARVSREIEG